MTETKPKYLQHGDSVIVKGSYELKPDAHGTITTSSLVKIPEGYVGLIEIRESYGTRGLICTSNLIWAGFEGHVKIHVKNGGANTVDVLDGTAIVHIAILKAYNGVID